MPGLQRRAMCQAAQHLLPAQWTAISWPCYCTHQRCEHEHDERGVLKVGHPQLEQVLGRYLLEAVGAEHCAPLL